MATLKLKRIGKSVWEVSAKGFDFVVSKRPNGEFWVDQFKARVKDPNKAYVESFLLSSLASAITEIKAIVDWKGA